MGRHFAAPKYIGRVSDELEPRKRSVSIHPFFVYTTLRIAILLLSLGLFYVLGFRDIMLIIVAFLVAGVVSFVVLNKWRDRMGERIDGYFARMRDRIDDQDEELNAEDELIAAHEADMVETPAEATTVEETTVDETTVDLSDKKSKTADPSL